MKKVHLISILNSAYVIKIGDIWETCGRNINETDKGPNKYGLPKSLMNLTSNKSSENSRKVTWFM